MSKPALLFLHGALGASDQFAALAPLLGDRYELHLLDFEGHGPLPLPSRPFRIEHFAQNVRDYLDRHGIEQANIFGYSMGGFVACTLALTHPHLVGSIATLGTKYYWDQETAAHEVGMLDPEKIAAKVPRYAQALGERHTGAGWENVVTGTQSLLQDLGERGGLRPGSAAGVEHRVRVIIGDRDTTVTLAESVDIFHALPNGQLEVLPNTPHPLEKVSPKRLAYSLTEFFG